MKAWDIIVEEMKKEGLEIAEETVKAIYKTLKDKALPRIALEAEEEKAKQYAPVILLVVNTLDPVTMPQIEKINPLD